MSCQNFVVLPDGKYRVKNSLASWSQVVTKALGSVCSHFLALDFNENKKTLKLIASLETPFSFNISQTSKKYSSVHWGSSSSKTWNEHDCLTIWMKAGLSSNIYHNGRSYYAQLGALQYKSSIVGQSSWLPSCLAMLTNSVLSNFYVNCLTLLCKVLSISEFFSMSFDVLGE